MNDATPVPVKNRQPAPVESPFGWLRNEIDRLFEDFGRPSRGMFNFGGQFGPVPALDMTETDQEYRLTAELPGLKEDDVEISVADGMLTLTGEKREEEERKDKGLLVSERRFGSFSRAVRVPSDVDPEAIKAQFDKGVLTITLAKDHKAPAATRKIAIEKA